MFFKKRQSRIPLAESVQLLYHYLNTRLKNAEVQDILDLHLSKNFLFHPQ